MNEKNRNDFRKLSDMSFNNSEEFSLSDEVRRTIKKEIDINCGEIKNEDGSSFFSFLYKKRKYIALFDNDDKNYMSLICLLRYIVKNYDIDEKYISSVSKKVNYVNNDIKLSKCIFMGHEDNKLFFSFFSDQLLFTKYKLKNIIINLLNNLDSSVDELIDNVRSIREENKDGDKVE